MDVLWQISGVLCIKPVFNQLAKCSENQVLAIVNSLLFLLSRPVGEGYISQAYVCPTAASSNPKLYALSECVEIVQTVTELSKSGNLEIASAASKCLNILK